MRGAESEVWAGVGIVRSWERQGTPMGKEAALMTHCCPGAALLGAAHLLKGYHVISTKDNGAVGWS